MTPQHFDDAQCQRETEPGTGHLAHIFAAIETLEYMGQIVGRDPGTVVFDLKFDAMRHLFSAEHDPGPRANAQLSTIHWVPAPPSVGRDDGRI